MKETFFGSLGCSGVTSETGEGFELSVVTELSELVVRRHPNLLRANF